jgi:hypothetical protein
MMDESEGNEAPPDERDVSSKQDEALSNGGSHVERIPNLPDCPTCKIGFAWNKNVVVPHDVA